MQKTDLMEIKKTLKKDKLTISRMCTCYVSTDKSIHTRYKSFLNLPDAELYKYIELLKKLMSCKAGDTLQTLSLKNTDCKKALDAIRSSELKQADITEALLKQLVDIYDEPSSYAIFLFYSAYDIPAKGSDKLHQGESDETYSAIYAVFCPIDTSEPGLSYYSNDQEFHNRELEALVGSPTVGFIYPDFDARSVDDEKIVYGICSAKSPHKELCKDIFGTGSPLTAKDQAQAINETIAEVITDKSKVAQVTGSIMKKIAEVQEESEEEPEESSVEDLPEKPKKKAPVEIDVDLIKDAVISCGSDESEAELFAKTLREKNTADTVRIDKVPKKSKVKVGDIDITIPADKIADVTTEMRSGDKYVVIRLSGADSEMYINGIQC